MAECGAPDLAISPWKKGCVRTFCGSAAHSSCFAGGPEPAKATASIHPALLDGSALRVIAEMKILAKAMGKNDG